MPSRILLALLAAGCLLAGCGAPPERDGAPSAGVVPALHPRVDALEAAEVTLVRGDGSSVGVAARVADSPGSRRRGLMEVTRLPDGVGMLFLFDGERHGGFWMRDTPVPLDIAFAGQDGTIRAILTMPVCREDPCPVHDPGVAYSSALEVRADWFRSVDVRVGDRLEWESASEGPAQ